MCEEHEVIFFICRDDNFSCLCPYQTYQKWTFLLKLQIWFAQVFICHTRIRSRAWRWWRDGDTPRRAAVVEKLVAIAFGITRKFRTREESNASTIPRSGSIVPTFQRIMNNEDTFPAEEICFPDIRNVEQLVNNAALVTMSIFEVKTRVLLQSVSQI